jgi:DNA-binding CsgD family transcriptional regulator
VSVLRAVIADRESGKEQALVHMLHALELGHVQGYRRVFLDEGDLVRPSLLLVRSSEPGIVPTHLAIYAESLCKALERNSKDCPDDGASPLSEREHEVLRGLSEGKSNKLIARKLDLSAATVNFHVRNVFRKLSVRKRASAVAKARRRGLLS